MVLVLAFFERLIDLKHAWEIVGGKIEPNIKMGNCLDLSTKRNSESQNIFHGLEKIENSDKIMKGPVSQLISLVQLWEHLQNDHMGRIFGGEEQEFQYLPLHSSVFFISCLRNY